MELAHEARHREVLLGERAQRRVVPLGRERRQRRQREEPAHEPVDAQLGAAQHEALGAQQHERAAVQQLHQRVLRRHWREGERERQRAIIGVVAVVPRIHLQLAALAGVARLAAIRGDSTRLAA